MHSIFSINPGVIAETVAENSGGEQEVFGASIEFFNLFVALIALYFALRILPSISHDMRKRSWLFLSLSAITFAIAETLGLLREINVFELDGLYEITETVFVLMFAVGFFYLYTSEHREALRLKQQSTTDDLTSLFTHGFFQTYLHSKLDDMKRDSGEMTVLFVDIDDFKKYNDEFGHQNGDYVLQKVAQAISQEARGGDIASRYGGEEFTLILGCDFETAVGVAERIKDGVETRCSSAADSDINKNITVSIGLASFGRDADDADMLVRIADARMYQAKKLGKNRVYSGKINIDSRQYLHSSP